MNFFRNLSPRNKFFFLKRYLSNPSLLSQEDIKTILEFFPFREFYEDYNLNYLTIKLLRTASDKVDIGYLSRKLRVSQKTAIEILRNPCIEIKFPVAKEGKASLNKLMVIPLSEEYLSTERLKKEDLTTIKKLTKKGFFLSFNKLFNTESSSYTLALYVALIYGETFSSIAFTGKVSPSGHIEKVDYLAEKINVCKKEGVPLLYPSEGEIDTLEKLHLFLDYPEVPVYICPSKEEGKHIFLRNFLFSEDYFRTVFHLEKPLSYTQEFKEEKAPESFEKFVNWLKELGGNLKRIKDYFLPNLTVGVTTNPLVFSFMAGVVFSKNRIGVNYYKYFKEGENYYKIYSIKDDRDIPTTEGVKSLISISDSQGDKIKISVREEDDFEGIFIKIPSGEILDRHAKELAYHVNNLIRSLEDKSFELILETPNDFAFALGYFLEDYKSLILIHKGKIVSFLKKENPTPYYLINTFSLNMLTGKKHFIKIEEISLEKVRELAEKEKFMSFISHQSTAKVLEALLGRKIEYRRENLKFHGGEKLIVFQLKVRPKAGQVFSEGELREILTQKLFKFFLVKVY